MSKLEDLIQELCPNGVEYKPLKEIFNTKNGYTPSKSNPEFWENGTIPWFRMEDLRENGRILSSSNQLITPEGVKKSLFPAYSIIIATTATIGEHALITVPFLANQQFTCLMLKPEYTSTFNIKFLFYCCFKLDEYCKGALNQSSFASVDMKKFANFLFPIPPLEVQEEIVRILDTFTQLTNELTNELTARKQQYEYYRDQLIQSANGKKMKLIDILSQPITDGPHTTPQFVEDGVPFISVDSIWDGKIHFENKRGYISEAFDSECSKKYKPRKHDVFMVKSGSTTGKVAYVDTDIKFNIWSPLAALRVNDKNSSRYLYHLLQTSFIQEQVKSKSSHGSQPNLSMRVLEKFQVNVPLLEEQERIVAILDRFDALCNDLTSGLPAEIEARQKQYEYYRDKLLSFKELKEE